MISLCMICGNEEAIILACLESAKGAFDELCLVRAIGNREADGTLDLAAKWCSENGKECNLEEYKNEHPLPHVDNFAAARNLSFSLASHEWILWLDCDDCLDEINCRRFRALEKEANCSAVMCKYLVEKQGAEIFRERLIRRGKGRWKNAIHETCVIDGPVHDCPQISVFHSDHKKKNKSSAERNATILERVLEDAPRHYFYLQAELKMLGRKEDALRCAIIALAVCPENQPEWKYVILLNLSELDAESAEKHLHEAVRTQPHRREAFAYLAQKALIDGRLSDAQSYFRMMDALPLPSPLPWTHQGIWYGWARNDLYVRLLRATSYTELAEKHHAEFSNDPEYLQGIKDSKTCPSNPK